MLCSFDVLVWEFWWLFIVGVQLVMVELEVYCDLQVMQQFFVCYGVIIIYFVLLMLVVFVVLLDVDSVVVCCMLWWVFCSGEVLLMELCCEWECLIGVLLYNLYGLMEVVVDVSWYLVCGFELVVVIGSSVLIGWLVWNIGLCIFDVVMCLVLLGVVGDFYFIGIQLVQGYLGCLDFIVSCFIVDLFVFGEWMYCIGDVVCWLVNGVVEYFGCSDDQLKICGQCIEFGEIDWVMLVLLDVGQVVSYVCVFNQVVVIGGDV